MLSNLEIHALYTTGAKFEFELNTSTLENFNIIFKDDYKNKKGKVSIGFEEIYGTRDFKRLFYVSRVREDGRGLDEHICNVVEFNWEDECKPAIIVHAINSWYEKVSAIPGCEYSERKDGYYFGEANYESTLMNMIITMAKEALYGLSCVEARIESAKKDERRKGQLVFNKSETLNIMAGDVPEVTLLHYAG